MEEIHVQITVTMNVNVKSSGETGVNLMSSVEIAILNSCLKLSLVNFARVVFVDAIEGFLSIIEVCLSAVLN